jgi:hypothetical protein
MQTTTTQATEGANLIVRELKPCQLAKALQGWHLQMQPSSSSHRSHTNGTSLILDPGHLLLLLLLLLLAFFIARCYI